MKTVFPWKTIASPLPLDVSIVTPSDALVNEDSRIVMLGGIPWTELRMVVHTRQPQDFASNPHLEVLATLDCPDTRDRAFTTLTRGTDGDYSGELIVDRDAVAGRGELGVTFVDTSHGRFLGRTVNWTIWYDDRQIFVGDPTRGPFPVSWVDFANPSGVDRAVAEALHGSGHASWFLAADATGSTVLYLNDGIDGFRTLVEFEGGGRRGRLRDLVGAQLGAEIIRDLVLRAIAAIEIDDDDDDAPPQPPADPILLMSLEHYARIVGVADEDRPRQYREWRMALDDSSDRLARLTSEIAAAAAQMTQLGVHLSKAAKDGSGE